MAKPRPDTERGHVERFDKCPGCKNIVAVHSSLRVLSDSEAAIAARIALEDQNNPPENRRLLMLQRYCPFCAMPWHIAHRIHPVPSIFPFDKD